MQCREIYSVEPFEIGIVILQSVSEWQCDKVDWSGKNVDFSMATSLEKSKKAQWCYQALTAVYTNPEILVKIGPLASGLAGLWRRPLKNKK